MTAGGDHGPAPTDLSGAVQAAAAAGRWGDAEAVVARALAEAARAGAATQVARARLARADLAARRGRWLDALRDAEAAWLGAPALGGPVVARLCLALGDPRRARPIAEVLGDDALHAEIALQLGEDPGPLPPALRPWAAALADRWAEVDPPGLLQAWRAFAEGDPSRAAERFDASRAALAAEGRPAEAARCGVWAAGALADAGDPDAALARLTSLEPELDAMDEAVAGAPFDLARARIARARGDGITAAALAASARARSATPPLSTQLDLRRFGA